MSRRMAHPRTAVRGNLFGAIGMGIAILTTLLLAKPSFGSLALIVLGIAIGGGAGGEV